MNAHERVTRATERGVFLTMVALFAACPACGGRTGLESGDLAAPDPDAGEEPAVGDAEAVSLSFCAFRAGPVASCDIAAGLGPVQRCEGTFSKCANAGGGFWGCCVGPGPYDGPGGSCVFKSFCQ